MNENSLRVRLDFAYDGTMFHGWAKQPEQRTVQGELESGIARILRQDVATVVAGRTDAGVHSRGQVVHIDVDPVLWQRLPGRSDRSPELAFIHRLTAVLPVDIAARKATVVSKDFDARFSASARTYKYRISDNLVVRDPLRRDVLRYRTQLDENRMHEAAQALLGKHDFLSYARPREGATTIRTLLQCDFQRPGEGMADEGLIVATVKADAFAHHMVRSIVGEMMAIGEGKREIGHAAKILAAASRDPKIAAPMAPPGGLTLEAVEYPDPAEYGAQAEKTRRRRALDDD